MFWVCSQDEFINCFFGHARFPLHGSADLVDDFWFEVVDQRGVFFRGEGAGRGEGGEGVARGVGWLIRPHLLARVIRVFVGFKAAGSEEGGLILIKAEAITSDFGVLPDEVAIQEA